MCTTYTNLRTLYVYICVQVWLMYCQQVVCTLETAHLNKLHSSHLANPPISKWTL